LKTHRWRNGHQVKKCGIDEHQHLELRISGMKLDMKLMEREINQLKMGVEQRD
jgi:hypothetical protein